MPTIVDRTVFEDGSEILTIADVFDPDSRVEEFREVAEEVRRGVVDFLEWKRGKGEKGENLKLS